MGFHKAREGGWLDLTSGKDYSIDPGFFVLASYVKDENLDLFFFGKSVWCPNDVFNPYESNQHVVIKPAFWFIGDF